MNKEESNEALEVLNKFINQGRTRKDLDEPFFGQQGEGQLSLRVTSSKLTCVITYDNGQVISHQSNVIYDL
jgi:hypothetical protein